jgi:Flp pilus assembly protein TadD
MFGIQAARQDLWDEAIFRWKRVIQIQPDSAAAHNNLAVAYEKKGMWDEAEEEYKIALKLSPANKHIQSNYEKFKKHLETKEKENNEKKDKNNN